MSDPAEHDERVMTLAAQALILPPNQRANLLQSSCQNDPELYREVSEVVAWEERMSGFLTRPLVEFIDLEALEKIFEPGQTIADRFEIRRCIGDGGMGVVYEAFDNKRKQRIAIKVAKPGFGRLLSPELEGALKVRHPNICVVNEIHTTKTEFGNLDFLTMEFLDGETLSSRLTRGKLDKAEALEIARQLCSAVAEAHRSGVLHRDLKPGNVILCRNKDGSARAVITDFGLCSDEAIAGEVEGGTPSYMSPELLRGEKASQASDVFSLGAILYEMITGQRPFPASDSKGMARPPAVPSKLVRSLPHRWDRAVLPCLRAVPEERCSAKQIINVLERKPFHRRLAAVFVAAACLALVAFSTYWIYEIVKPPPVRLAVLPAQGPTDLTQRTQQILDNVAERVQQMQTGKATASLIPLSKALSKGVTTPQDAVKILGATHALQVALHPDSEGVAVEAAIIDLSTMAHVRDYSAHFDDTNLDDLPGGLAGLASWALHLKRRTQPETVNPAAATAYKNGREYLDREPPDFMAAMPEFQEAVRLDPHSPLPLAGMAEASTRKNQAQKDENSRNDAQAWLAKAEALNPDSITVHMASGLQHAIQGNNLSALEDYQRVEEIQPGNVEAWLGSGLAYELQGMLDKAISDYRHAISVDPNDYKPYEYLGALYFQRGEYDKAVELYKQDIKRAPNRANAYGNLGAAYYAQFNYAEAENAYKTLFHLRGANALALNNMGAALAFQGRQEEAIKYYRQAIAKNPNNLVYWLNLGDSQRRIKDLPGSRRSYGHGLVVAVRHIIANPTSALSRAYVAYLEARLGLKNQARSDIAAALNSPARDDQVVLCGVQTYEALGDRNRALAAAAIASAQTRTEMAHHPDLAGLQADSRFRVLIGQSDSGSGSPNQQK